MRRDGARSWRALSADRSAKATRQKTPQELYSSRILLERFHRKSGVKPSAQIAQGNRRTPKKAGLKSGTYIRQNTRGRLESCEIGVEVGDGFYAPEIILEGDVFVRGMGIFIG